MRSQKRKVSGSIKSQSKIEIVLSVEEAKLLMDCDPNGISQLVRFLTHLGVIEPVEDIPYG